MSMHNLFFFYFKQKDIKIRDFQNIDVIGQLDLESVELPHLKKLYMLQPTVHILRHYFF